MCHLRVLVGQPSGGESLCSRDIVDFLCCAPFAMMRGCLGRCNIPFREQISIMKPVIFTSLSLYIQQLLQPRPRCRAPQRGLHIQQYHLRLGQAQVLLYPIRVFYWVC